MIDYFKKISLKGKVCFVTGGSGLIGKEISTALSQAGAICIILDIDEKKSIKLVKELKIKKLNAFFERFDITDLKNLDVNIYNLILKYKKVDVWINNAYPRTLDWGNIVENINLESWRKNIDMHLNSYAWISRHIGLYMKKNKIKGTIINISSIYGVLGNDFTVYEGTKLTSPMGYAAIKGGITNLTRYLASYFGKYGIRFNSVCPGGIFNNQDIRFVRNYEKKVPLKRMGRPDDVASAVIFIASEAASYISGATIMIDGGWSAI